MAQPSAQRLPGDPEAPFHRMDEAGADNKGCWGRLRSEFALANLTFTASTSHGRVDWVWVFGSASNRFGLTSWGRHMAARSVLGVLCFAVLGWSVGVFAASEDFSFYFIYLTHWTLMLECLYFALAMWVTWGSKDWDKFDGPEDDMPLVVRAVWFLQAVLTPATLMVVVMYWGLVFDGDFSLLSTMTHGANFVLMAADVAIAAQPYLLLHGVYFVLYGAVFVAWSLVHHATSVGNEKGEGYIYSSLDWSTPGKTRDLAAGMIFLAMPMVGTLAYLALSGCRGTVRIADPAAQRRSRVTV